MNKKIKKKFLFWGIVFIVAVVIIILISRKPKEQDILSINLREHKNLALHIHPYVEIEINRELQTIPPNVGISGNRMRVIHTHDLSGKLHVESPYPHQFYLRDFFTIWGKNLNDTCIFNYCESSSHKLFFYANGKESGLKSSIPLNDGDKIKIVYK